MPLRRPPMFNNTDGVQVGWAMFITSSAPASLSVLLRVYLLPEARGGGPGN